MSRWSPADLANYQRRLKTLPAKYRMKVSRGPSGVGAGPPFESHLTIPRIPCSPNDLLGHHWRHRQRDADVWQDEISLAVNQWKDRPGQPLKKAHIQIHRRSRGQLDPDNLYGSVKHLIDALRYCQVIENDTAEHVTLTVTQSRGVPTTFIRIEAIDGNRISSPDERFHVEPEHHRGGPASSGG